MSNLYDGFDRYGDEMQNLGLRAREHERADALTRQERALFGLGEERARRAEALNRLTDENGFFDAEDGFEGRP